MTDSHPVDTAERPVTVTHVFDAPREAVFKSWIDPDQVARWFGPAAMEVPRESVEIDPRVGGRFNLRMVQPGGGFEYGLRYEIVEIVEPELLVLKSGPMPEVGLNHETIARIELTEDGGKTRLTITDGPYPEEGGKSAGAGWQDAFAKLAALLAG
jgi:uncharacterized protein YndB with AHSA1/START domain